MVNVYAGLTARLAITATDDSVANAGEDGLLISTTSDTNVLLQVGLCGGPN